MQLNVPPDLEALINKRLSSGVYTDAEDVLRRALEAQDAEESWTDEERRALSAHIEEGYLQAERGELIDGCSGGGEVDGSGEIAAVGYFTLDDRGRDAVPGFFLRRRRGGGRIVIGQRLSRRDGYLRAALSHH